MEPTPAWEGLGIDECLQKLDSGPQGLTNNLAQQRQHEYGRNELPPPARRGPLRRFLAQFHNVLIYVLLAAGAVTLLLQHWVDAAVIFAVVVINALIGFLQEGKAQRAMDSISRMMPQRARVMRDGEPQILPAAELVPGDVVLLEGGDRIPADARLLQARGARVDESGLTGESVPVDKQTDPVETGLALADQASMVWSGTLMAAGQARALVTATGTHTELGRIKQATESAGSLSTPLLRKIDQFGRQLTVAIMLLAGLTFAVGTFWHQGSPTELFFAAVGLAVAAIPEGLPAVITITLALGVQAMAHHRAIVRRLPAVEALGSVTVICSDKTGTLTRNEMTLRGIHTAACTYQITGEGYDLSGDICPTEDTPGKTDPALDPLILAGVLCNDASLEVDDSGSRITGDPMEAAMLVAGRKHQLHLRDVNAEWPRTDAIPFEPEYRYMATLHHNHEGEGRVLVKGALERVLPMCDQQLGRDGPEPMATLDHWNGIADAYAREGQRTLALAYRPVPGDHTTLERTDVEKDLILLGIIALEDPPRQEAMDAVQECLGAGIRVKMITGDHLGTALAIGARMGIGDGHSGMTGADFQALSPDEQRHAARRMDVFARFSPDNKLTLVNALRDLGDITAMTGDGVNDSPALRSADVGVAMGRGGTDAAREASDIVLVDDNFATIAGAVKQGRGLYDNIRKSLTFILPTNGGQALLILAAVLIGLTLPVTPIQILWVNMVTAVTLALALTMEPVEPGIMRRPPRPPRQPILTLALLWRIALVSSLILAASLALFQMHFADSDSLALARTAAVNGVIGCQIFYLLSCRHHDAPVLSVEGLRGNPWVYGAIGLIVVLQAGFTYLPVMQQLFGTVALPLASWGWILALSLPVLLIVELEKTWLRRAHRYESETPDRDSQSDPAQSR